MTFDPTSWGWGHMSNSTRILCPTPMEQNHSVWIQWPFLNKQLKTKRSMTPTWPLIPLLLGVTCLTLTVQFCPSPIQIHQYMWIYVVPKNFNQKFNDPKMIPKWPLTQYQLRSHVQLYPRIILSNYHKNTSKHIDAVTFFCCQKL